MENLEKEFTLYQEAFELKELGFDEPCFGYYINNKFQFFADVRSCNTNSEFGFYPTAPTFSQAFRWFREKYNIEGITQHAEDRLWYKFHISTYLQYGKKNIHAGFEYPTYEEAELACLRKLIEIVKEKQQ